MATIHPISAKHELVARLVKAVGLPFPGEKMVIEIDAYRASPVRVYVKGLVEPDVMTKVCDAFELVPVADVTVADDATVTAVPPRGREFK